MDIKLVHLKTLRIHNTLKKQGTERAEGKEIVLVSKLRQLSEIELVLFH